MEMDLRLGNFVTLSDIEVRLNHHILSQLQQDESKTCEPILLTESWLDKLGFYYLAASRDSVAYFLNGMKEK